MLTKSSAETPNGVRVRILESFTIAKQLNVPVAAAIEVTSSKYLRLFKIKLKTHLFSASFP